jgi:hypothetical protein
MGLVAKPGSRFRSAVCDTQVMVIKAPTGEVALTCGGVDMLPATAPASSAAPTMDPTRIGGTLIGKRYVNAEESLELLCVKGGSGSLFVAGTPLAVKQAKQLPSSD